MRAVRSALMAAYAVGGMALALYSSLGGGGGGVEAAASARAGKGRREPRLVTGGNGKGGREFYPPLEPSRTGMLKVLNLGCLGGFRLCGVLGVCVAWQGRTPPDQSITLLRKRPQEMHTPTRPPKSHTHTLTKNKTKTPTPNPPKRHTTPHRSRTCTPSIGRSRATRRGSPWSFCMGGRAAARAPISVGTSTRTCVVWLVGLLLLVDWWGLEGGCPPSTYTRTRNHTRIYIHTHILTHTRNDTLSIQVYRIVVFDQRGCGQSTPHACLEENTCVYVCIYICIYVYNMCMCIYLVMGGHLYVSHINTHISHYLTAHGTLSPTSSGCARIWGSRSGRSSGARGAARSA